MNNTTTKRNLSLVAIFMAATLVVGTFAVTTTTIATTQTAFAFSKNKKGDENSKNGNTITALKCENKGSASGFDTTTNQECENLICTHPGNNASCVSENEGATTTTSPVTTPTGTLIVKKIEICRIGNTCPSPSDFTIKVTGNNPTPSTFHVTSPGTPGTRPSTVVTLGVGAYKVSEEPFQGFEPSFSADCTGTISPGDQKTCTITNSQPS
jgi:hypothetical protein